MKAITYYHYGSPDQLQLQEVDKPKPKPGEVLVKVMAVSLNSWDLDMLRGNAWIIRLLSGLFKPRHHILGADIAGIVESVGAGVTFFKVGDEVFGDIAAAPFGGFAQYAVAPENLLAKKPKSISFSQAAALPQAGLLALQGLRLHGELQAGQKILINGAGGGVGTLALQYAKHIGCEVTCVDTEEKFELLRSLGADHLIDFKKQDYTKTGIQYDKILDVIAHRSASDYKRALKPTGIFSMIGGSMGGLLVRMMLVEPIVSRFRKKKMGIMGYRPNRKDLDNLADLCETGIMSPIIDSSFPLDKCADAFHHFISGKFVGKIILEVGHP